MNANHAPAERPSEASNASVQRVERMASAIQRGCALRDTAFLNNIIDSVADPILVKDSQLRFLLVNQALCDFTGLARERFIGRTDADLFPAHEAATFNAMDRRVFDTCEPNVNEEEHTHADGSVRTIRTTKTMFVDEDGSKVLVGIFTDLTALRATQRELEAANRQLNELARRDRLTGLPNRMAFEEALSRTVSEAQRHGGSFVVMFMDLNGFKQVNDTHGHATGDELIQATARRLSAVVRESDFMARLGGDEFVVIARTGDQLEARHLAERLSRALKSPFALSSAEVQVSVSIGLAGFPQDGVEGADLIRRADAAMYRAKRVTLQPFEFYDASQSALAKRRFALETQLRRDVDAGRIGIHVQPIVRLIDRRVLGYEALARWTHAEYGAVPPLEFIALAEESQLIVRLGMSVMRKACEFIVAHGGPDQYVTVNVSARQLEAPDFVDGLRGILAETGAAAGQLAIELTESAGAKASAAGVLSQVRAAGVMLFMDDFGVGYSNLMQLQRLPFGVVKIDRSFVSELGRSPAGAAMIRTIVVLARELGFEVIAEGIETPAQMAALRELGVTTGQGYFLGRPAPAALVPRDDARVGLVTVEAS